MLRSIAPLCRATVRTRAAAAPTLARTFTRSFAPADDKSKPAGIPLTTAGLVEPAFVPVASVPLATAAIPLASSSTGSPPPKKPTHRVRTFARAVLLGVVGGATYIVYTSYLQRHPHEQLDFDPSLPTVAVLGNGWASTAFLKQLDNTGYNVVVISPRNYFLFTPLLPSVTVGTLAARSVIEPTRFLTRHLPRKVEVYEGEVTAVDVDRKVLKFIDNSEINKDGSGVDAVKVDGRELKYDYLVYAVGAENQTFGIQGVKENACFLKELGDAEKIRSRLMDCIETATFAGQSQAEIERLLSFVVVGGGPTGVEYAGELYDFLKEDLAHWYPEVSDKIKITLIEALPNVLPMFSKQLIDYTMSTFKENRIDIATKTMVKKVTDKSVITQNEKGEVVEYPYGLLVWATGNTARPLTRDLMASLPDTQTSRRGLLVDEHLRLLGADGVFALGDCTATNYAPTAQAASQQGKYLARVFSQLHKKALIQSELVLAKAGGEDASRLDKLANGLIRASEIREFHYSHQGSLAYIGSDKAIADLPFLSGNFAMGGFATYYFWRSAYASQLFSLRNRVLVVTDWAKTKVLGRDVSRE